MITIEQWMQVVKYRISEGYDYQWKCFGDHAYCLSFWNGDHNGHSLNIIFDTQNQNVYQVELCDYKNQKAYRLTNKDYQKAYDKEAKSHNIDDVAWDNVSWNELELEDDWLDKAQAVVNDKEYDHRISIPVEFSDEELLKYMKAAHEQDITFNQYVENALIELIKKHNVNGDLV